MEELKLTIYKKEDTISIENLLERFLYLSNITSYLRGGAVEWFLTGKSKTEALKKKIFHENKMTDEALSLLDKKRKSLPSITETIWNNFDDIITASNYICESYNNISYQITVRSPNIEPNFESVVKYLSALIRDLTPHIVTIETNDYSFNQSQTFPDRLPIGWMFYIDQIFDKNTLNLDEHMVAVNNDGMPIGSLFISKRGLFDGENKEDIKIANALEIALVEHEILPTYRAIFKG
ncbi:hypothetical protein [Lonsdalea quercina]|uniref:hypothetical protein n=1 Tax=Lonsdalea quercina TaxID=71657 RepID=UPI0039770E29